MKSKKNMKNIYEEPYQLVKEEFLNGLDFITNTTGQLLLNHLANINNDIEFLIDCHNIISHQWRYKIHLQSRKVINDHTKWIVFYDGSLLHNAIIDVYKILGKYLFIEKQGLDNQIWTKEYREMIIKLKTAEFERDNYKRLLDAKDN